MYNRLISRLQLEDIRYTYIYTFLLNIIVKYIQNMQRGGGHNYIIN